MFLSTIIKEVKKLNWKQLDVILIKLKWVYPGHYSLIRYLENNIMMNFF